MFINDQGALKGQLWLLLSEIIELGQEHTAKQAESLCQVCKAFRIPLVLYQPLSWSYQIYMNTDRNGSLILTIVRSCNTILHY